MPTDAKTDVKTLTKEEIAHLIRTLWSSLQAPAWTHKNRRDLEKLGEAIFSGKSLKDLDDTLYDRIFPHLVTVATHLGNVLRTTSPEKTRTDPIPRDSDPLATITPMTTTIPTTTAIAPLTTTSPAESPLFAKAK
jgi:hypothetical protein